ncbi:MAG TPA: chromate resistance protein ChrB domain-containing protein [Thermoanaerobaculia bacterium]|nr:chromate resistance protein ChrB domain-containing protein [Thermoanaerobaculia bacterium]
MKKPARAKKGHSPLSWYLLIHQLPPEPLYLRAKIRQRLARVGAAALKNAVYALPRREECLEDLEWIAEEAVSGGGEAYVCEAEFLEARTDEALVARFREERNADYEAMAEALRAPAANDDPAARLARARKRFADIAGIDFFGASGRSRVERLLRGLESEARRRTVPAPGPSRSDLKGKTWVTRRGIHIDRIASAWLVRRFLDPKARFRFIDAREPRRKGELRFDMVGGDFTHEGDRCTFETLLTHAGIRDRALAGIAEIIHDIDLKDEKFGRAEAAGIERLVTGLILANPEDEARLERGFVLFDELYQSFWKKSPVLTKEIPK